MNERMHGQDKINMPHQFFKVGGGGHKIRIGMR